MSLLNLRLVEPKVVLSVTVLYDMSLLNLRLVEPKVVFPVTVVYDIQLLNLIFTIILLNPFPAKLLGPAWDRYPIRFILPEFVSYLRERGVLCVGKGSHLCTPVLMNMCNITLQLLRLSTFVFTKCSEKNKSRLYLWLFVVKTLKGFSWKNVGPA